MQIPDHTNSPIEYPASEARSVLAALRHFTEETCTTARFHHTILSGALKVWRLPDDHSRTFLAFGSHECPFSNARNPKASSTRKNRSPLSSMNVGDQIKLPINPPTPSQTRRVRERVFRFAQYHNKQGHFSCKTIADGTTRFVQVTRTK